ncbi:MAG: OmpA family protein [Sphingomonas sp.]
MKLLAGRLSIVVAILFLAGCQTSMHPRSPWSQKQIETMRSEGFAPTDRGWELSVNDRLLFPTDESHVDPGQATLINRMATHLRAVRIRRATIEGHADWTGTERHNETLSKHRADAVAAVFANAGFARADLRTVGLGERYPIEDNKTATGRRENRRVVILLTAP